MHHDVSEDPTSTACPRSIQPRIYTVYRMCGTIGNSLSTSYVDDVGGTTTTLASTGVQDNEVDIADPKVSFGDDEYSVDEGGEVTVTVELSHRSSHVVYLPITFRGTAESADYVVEGLSRNDELVFRNRSTSETFTIVANEDADGADETVNLRFGTLPSTVMGTESPSSATVTIQDDDTSPEITDGPFSVSYAEGGTGSVATYRASDPGDSITWSLGGIDRRDFDISSRGVLTFDDVPDYEDPEDSDEDNVYEITVRASAGVLAASRNVTVTVTDVNERPDVAGLFSPSYDENGTRAVETYTADDPEDDDVTWSLRGTDRFDFRISSSGELTFRSSPDYEDPDDSNNDNVYRITVRASDGRLVTSVNVTVTVDDVNERPEVALPIADQTMTAGDSATVSLQGRFSDTDGDTLTYTAATSASTIATASVRRSTLTLTAVSAGSATITVTAADRSLGHADRLTVSQDFTVTVDETNVPPTFDEGPRTTRSVAENTPSSNDVGSPVAASDDDNDTLTYELSGTDAGSFTIGRISGQIRTSASLDFETKNSYSVTVTADDGNEGTDSIDVTINVTDVNESPDVAGPSSPSYDENRTDAVATYTADDPEGGSITWSLLGTDRFDFRISSSGVLTFRSAPDFESPHDSNRDNIYRITVRASDGRLAASVNVTVTVTNVNERPSVASAIADHTMTAGDSTTISLQGRFSDPDGDTLAYTAATSDSETATASVRRSTLTLTAVSAGSATITVTAADRSLGHADRLTVSQDFTVTVDETNAEPTFDEGPRTTRSVAENAASSTDVGSPVAASDADNDTLTYELSGTDAGSFTIGRISGQIRTFDSLDFETKNSYSVTVTVDDDNGGSDSIDVTINVTDVNERPDVAGPSSPSHDENDTGDVETYTVDDPEDDDITWSLLGTDRFDFRISSSGVLTFRSAPDFESPHDSNRDNIYRITVRASDGRLAASVNVTVTVTNVNERPEVDLAITDQTMTVGVSRILSLQGTFSDPDTNDTLSYSANSSNIRVATASVSNSDITLTLTALSAGSATITVTVADRTSGDADRLTASQAFTVTVDEPNAPPTFEEDTNPTRSVAENTPSGAHRRQPSHSFR